MVLEQRRGRERRGASRGEWPQHHFEHGAARVPWPLSGPKPGLEFPRIALRRSRFLDRYRLFLFYTTLLPIARFSSGANRIFAIAAYCERIFPFLIHIHCMYRTRSELGYSDAIGKDIYYVDGKKYPHPFLVNFYLSSCYLYNYCLLILMFIGFCHFACSFQVSFLSIFVYLYL